MMANEDELIECFDTIRAEAPVNELAMFFESHGLSPDDWYEWDDGVDVYTPRRTMTWGKDDTIVWDTLRSAFQTPFQRRRVDEEDLLSRSVSEHRTRFYARHEDIEIWADCPDERVSVSNLGRVRSWAQPGKLLVRHKGGALSGPWVKANGRTLYVNDLIRKYIVSAPGMV